MNKKALHIVLIAVLAGIGFLTGCNKKVAKVTPPAAPAPAQPTATLAASPEVIQQGQSTTLTWSTANANNIMIQGLGEVPSTGSRSVTPNSSMTYTLVAKGPGGTQESAARVTVNPVAAKVVAPGPSEQDLFAKNVKDVFFDFNKADLRGDGTSISQNDAEFLAQHPDLKVVIEGHCDDRGSEEYNLALGDNRATALKDALIAQGVNANRIKIVSYGKEHPFCSDNNEQCWQQNRRDHVGLQQ